ncbi:hypothetical protein Q7C36_020532 [Tachysurus vachellii]|uniref:Uncharacterized protein n=1 Tax=Tachysurus vachellii TaxID=175792 RepID=A0AA88IW09_TACVA|nr:hypothetical protein Q7C36_020532 [Tachysurus vachellii]
MLNLDNIPCLTHSDGQLDSGASPASNFPLIPKLTHFPNCFMSSPCLTNMLPDSVKLKNKLTMLIFPRGPIRRDGLRYPSPRLRSHAALGD